MMSANNQSYSRARGSRMSVCSLVLAMSIVGLITNDAIAQFVEGDVVVLHTFSPVGGSFGWGVADMQDIDNPPDGVTDLISGAPGANRVFVYSGATGALLLDIPGPAGATNLGYAMADAGDVDNDGTNDIIAGAPGPGFGPNPGFAAVFSGVDGSVIWSWTGQAAGDSFGAAVAGIGDVNGDNHSDVLVGAPGNDGAAVNAGRCYLYSGIDGTEIRQFDGPSNGASFGSGTAGTGDLDGDLVGDLIVGAPGGGKAFAYSGSDGAFLFDTTPDAGNSTFGQFFVAGVGDVNNDGNRDVYVGDYNANGGNGRAYVYSGIDGSNIHTFIGTPGAGLGPGRGAGDVNGDGYADLLIGEYTSSAGANLAGRTRIYSGRTGAVLRTITSTTVGENLGFDAVGVGDVNGDDVIDLMISAAAQSRVYVIEGVEIACPSRDAPTAEPGGIPYNRYLAIDAGNPGSSTAIRVTMTTVGAFPAFDGQTRWVGPPALATDGGASMIQVAQLQCTPHYTDWSAVGIVYAHGPDVVPASTYDVQVIDEECAIEFEDGYSTPLTLTTQKWGDLVNPFGGGLQPNFGDVNALVEAFKQSPGAILRPQAQLQPNVVNTATSISFADINADVGAFKGNPYPFAGPIACP